MDYRLDEALEMAYEEIVKDSKGIIRDINIYGHDENNNYTMVMTVYGYGHRGRQAGDIRIWEEREFQRERFRIEKSFVDGSSAVLSGH